MNRLRVVICALTALVSLQAQSQVELDIDDSWMAEWPNELWLSSDPAHLLIGAILSDKLDAPTHPAEEFYARALAAAPDDVLVLSNLAGFCLRHPQDSACDPAVYRRLTELDADNGMAWQQAAAERLAAGDEDAALDLLARASSSDRFDDYFGRQVGLYDRGLRSYRAEPARSHALFAIGMAAAGLFAVGALPPACTNRPGDGAGLDDADASRWRATCLELGRAMERSGRTRISVGPGLSLQLRALEGDPLLSAELDAVMARKEARRPPYAKLDAMLTEGLSPDDPYYYTLLENLERWGEIAALEQARLDLSDRFQDGDDHAFDGAGDRLTPGYGRAVSACGPSRGVNSRPGR